MSNKGVLYMIPCPIGDGQTQEALPGATLEAIRSLDYFIVEDVRSARRFLSRAGIGKPIDSLTFAELNEHTPPEDIPALIAPLLEGRSAGVVSEAGMPGIADPGAQAAAICHEKGIRVVPLTGPSSLVLALAASGLNGQSFAFNGYLPVKQPERGRAIRAYEKRAHAEDQSQIFIETPYRNLKLFEDILAVCAPSTRLTVAASITEKDEYIRTAAISQWRSLPPPDINKRPAVFIIL